MGDLSAGPPRARAGAVAVGALLGAPIGFAAALYLLILHEATDAVWHDLPSAAGWSEVPWWYLLLVPAVAGLLVAAALRLPGRGGPPATGSLRIHPLLPGQLPSLLTAALAALAGGIVLGPEGPLLALGLTLGLLAARAMRKEGRDTRLLALAGAFAALGSVLGGPIASSLLLVELAVAAGLVTAGLASSLLPGLAAAGTGALVLDALGSWPGVDSSRLELSALPGYATPHVVDVAWCVPVAVVAAGIVVLARHAAERVPGGLLASSRGAGLRLAAGGLAIGGLALGFREVAGRPEDLVLFSGQGALPALAAETSGGVLAAALAAKGLAYAIALGAGFRGGPVIPAIALGVATGALGAEVLPGLALTPGVVAGLAAGAAAAMGAPFAAAALAVLVVAGAAPGAVPGAIVAAVTGWLVAPALGTPGRQAATASASRSGAPERARIT